MSGLPNPNALTRRLSRPPASKPPTIPLSHAFPARSPSFRSPPSTPPRLRPYSSAPSHPHSTLSSFLTHAARTSLSPTSSVYTGTIYEYLCLSALRRLGFRLTRVGGRGDQGVDLSGTWHLPGRPADAPLQAIVQCKALKLGTGPSLVRELEGALAGALPVASEGEAEAEAESGVAVLCAQRPATKGVREVLRKARRALVWVQVERVVEEGGMGGMGDAVGRAVVRQMLWNEAVERLGARGLDVTVMRTGDGDAEGGEIALLWNDEIWRPHIGADTVYRDGRKAA